MFESEAWEATAKIEGYDEMPKKLHQLITQYGIASINTALSPECFQVVAADWCDPSAFEAIRAVHPQASILLWASDVVPLIRYHNPTQRDDPIRGFEALNPCEILALDHEGSRPKNFQQYHSASEYFHSLDRNRVRGESKKLK